MFEPFFLCFVLILVFYIHCINLNNHNIEHLTMNKIIRYDDNTMVMTEMLTAIIAYSTCTSLAKIEMTAANMKRKVSISMVKYNTIGNSVLISDDARKTAMSVEHPNATMGHMAEQHCCMICTNKYHGSFDPDFGLYAHSRCIKSLLISSKILIMEHKYPIKTLFKQLPYSDDYNPQFLMSRRPGFPDKWTVDDMKHPGNGYNYYTELAIQLRYNESNTRSAKTVKRDNPKQWNAISMV
jgi:hypothetical protein